VTVCYKHKLIHIHIPKTAGTPIEHYFQVTDEYFTREQIERIRAVYARDFVLPSLVNTTGVVRADPTALD
jgi:hypothetical protein